MAALPWAVDDEGNIYWEDAVTVMSVRSFLINSPSRIGRAGFDGVEIHGGNGELQLSLLFLS